MKTLIYIHGFNSSSGSKKAKILASWFSEQYPKLALCAPNLSFSPAVAMSQLEVLLPRQGEFAFVGSSLGGYYANYLAEKYNAQAVLVNPAVNPYNLLEHFLGEQLNPYTHEQYTLTEQHINELRALTVSNMQHPQKRMVLLQMGDETLDYKQAESYYRGANLIVEQGGNHSFAAFDQWLARIAKFLGMP